MTELKIDRQQLLKLRSESHALNPMVLLGQNGLTDAVLKEIGKALDCHGLVKIRIPGDDREEREADIERILNEMGAARIQTIGKTVTIWRPMPEKENSRAVSSKDSEEDRPRSRGGKILRTDKKRIAKRKTPIRRAHPKRKRTVKKAQGAAS